MHYVKRVLRKSLVIILLLQLTISNIPYQKDGMEVHAATRPSNPRVVGGEMTWDCVYFGNYPQSDVTGKRKEPIKWRVLSVKGKEAFLLADYNLDVKPYNETYADVTWDLCTLRSWLNGYNATSNKDGIDYTGKGKSFYNAAFNKREKQAVLVKSLKNQKNEEYGTIDVINTKDPVFILSINELTNHSYGFYDDKVKDLEFGEKKPSYGENTRYAASLGGGLYEGDARWWLRDSLERKEYQIYTGIDSIYYAKPYHALTDFVAFEPSKASGVFESVSIDSKDCSIRPSLYLDLSSSQWSHAGTVNASRKEGKVPAPDKVGDVSAKGIKENVVNVKWKRVKNVDGYRLEYALNKSFTKGRKARTLKRTNVQIKGLRKKKTYHIRIRAFTINGRDKVFGKARTVRVRTK